MRSVATTWVSLGHELALEGLLLTTAAEVTGLSSTLRDGLSRWRKPTAVHDPGKVITDLSVTLALPGNRR